MGKYTEIFKLKEMLELAEIPYLFIDKYKEEKISMNKNNYLKMLEHYQILIYDDIRDMMHEGELYPILDEEKRVISIIQGYGTYGSNVDLLEIMGLLTEEEEKEGSVVGYLSAENVFDRIEKYYKNKKESRII